MQFGETNYIGLRNLENDSTEEKKATLIKGMTISLCLADVKCKEGDSNFGKQTPNFNFNIPYKVISRAVGQISLSVENIGTKTMPKYVLRASVSNINDGYDIRDVEYSFKRKIVGVDERYRQIALTKNNTYVDVPFEEGEIDIKKNYTIYYKVIGEFPDGRTLDSLNQNEFMDSYIILEEEEDENKFPTYAIVIVCVVCGLAVIGTGILMYRLLRAKSAFGELPPTNLENNTMKVSKFEKIENNSSSTSAIRQKKGL